MNTSRMPPSSAQAAQIIESAWEQDDECGMFVWLTMVTGMHRTELPGLRWQHVDLGGAMLDIRRNYV